MYHLLKLQFTYMYCSLLFYSFILPMVAKNQFSTNQKLIFFGFVGFKKARYNCIINTYLQYVFAINQQLLHVPIKHTFLFGKGTLAVEESLCWVARNTGNSRPSFLFSRGSPLKF